jgi:hypothetical protein
MPMASAAAPLLLDTVSCAPGRVACGFAVGDQALVADARARGEWFVVTVRDAAGLGHAPPALSVEYSSADETVLAGVEARTVLHDAATRQLRVASPGSDLPLVDGVAELTVRWFGDPRPPRGPIPPPGEANCVVDAAGASRLLPLPGSTTSWVELPIDSLSDGPWCGVAPWRFDADLFRVRLVRLRLRLERTAATGPAPAGATPSVAIDLAPRNLVRLR